MEIFNKIIVCCSQSVTGGPELLHQLVHTLRSLGHDAYICYYPFDQSFDCPEPYKKYDAPQIKFTDDSGYFLIVPESATWILKQVNKSKAAVWWLSVDNFFGVKHQSWFQDMKVKYKGLIRSRLPLFKMKDYTHFVQSAYALDFLKKAGILSIPLTDYLGADHLRIVPEDQKRRDIIVYNPKKGQKQTRKLCEANPDFEFVPIQNMTSTEVAQLLESAKIYIDFGHHPGKDRPPREAAMAGCCVITGLRGSAKYFEDVSIPDNYKIEDRSRELEKNFRSLVFSILENFPQHSKAFEDYRNKILNEPAIFQKQVEDFFGRRN